MDMAKERRRFQFHYTKSVIPSPEPQPDPAPRGSSIPPVRRHLGEIIDLGPQNDEEAARLGQFEKKEHYYFRKHFPGIERRDIKRRLYYSTFTKLRVIRGDYLHAIMRQGRPDADLLLAKIAEDVQRQGESPNPPSSRGEAPRTHGTAQTVGYGGRPNDCCQDCGRFLWTVCYSKQVAEVRVPRTNKICPRCYEALEPGAKTEYQVYKYRPGHEAKGTGFDPNKGG